MADCNARNSFSSPDHCTDTKKQEVTGLPLDRIPTKILSHIFTFTLPPHRLNDEHAPWTISAVCSHWRQTVISQPCFWVFVDLRHYERTQFTSRFRSQNHLSRSAALPLNVTFAMSGRTFTSENLSLLRLITIHAGGWETLSITGPETLHSQLHNSIPWPQLLRFRGSNKWNGHLHALRSATNLVSCALQIPQWTEPPSIPSTSILLPRLLQLSLPDVAVLECLETPALQDLHCPYVPALLPFLHRKHQLQKLVISAPPDVFENGGSRVLHAREFSNLDMVPALESFTARQMMGTNNFEIQNDFMHAVESRWQHGRLRSVKLPVHLPWAPSVLDRIEQLQSQDMDFVVASISKIKDEVAPYF